MEGFRRASHICRYFTNGKITHKYHSIYIAGYHDVYIAEKTFASTLSLAFSVLSHSLLGVPIGFAKYEYSYRIFSISACPSNFLCILLQVRWWAPVNNFMNIWYINIHTKNFVATIRRKVLFSSVKVDNIEVFISSVDAHVYIDSRQYFNKLGYPPGYVVCFPNA